MTAVLLAAVAPHTAIEAERAFAADAQRIGQWAAFRKWAAADATMFVPQPVNAQDWLRDRPSPPTAVAWSPIASYVSCDGATAVNTGEWRRPDGSVGYFTTVWRRQTDGQWRWTMDHGDVLKTARPRVASPRIRTASCSPGAPRVLRAYRFAGLQRPGRSADGSLQWYWRIHAATDPLPREFLLDFWTGKEWDNVIADDVAPPRP